MTKIIVGLGNPGEKYHETRHNIGFMVIDQLVKSLNIKMKEEKVFKAEIGSTFLEGEKIFLVKPMTFMNKSGEAVYSLLTYYGLSTEDLLVIYDDLDMDIGKIRFRQKGSAGGHNGIKDIIKQVGTQVFDRIKIGIGRPKPGRAVVNHVLSHFEGEDYHLIVNSIDKVEEGVKFYLTLPDFETVMRKYNG